MSEDEKEPCLDGVKDENCENVSSDSEIVDEKSDKQCDIEVLVSETVKEIDENDSDNEEHEESISEETSESIKVNDESNTEKQSDSDEVIFEFC